MFIMLSCRKKLLFTSLFALFSIFSIFLFLSPNANATNHIYYNDSSLLTINYRVCQDQTSSTGKYKCSTVQSASQLTAFYYDAQTGVSQYNFTPNYSYCSNSYPCRLVIDNYFFDIRNAGSVPSDPYVNGKVWTVLDFYFGKYPQMSGDLTWDNLYNIADSLDMNTTTSNGRFLCGDDVTGACNFGYWENSVVYDSVSTYSGFDFSLDTSIVSTNYLRVNFGAYPYDKSLGHLNMTNPVYDNILYETTNSTPIVFYASFWGSDSLQEVEDNGDDNGVTDIVQEMNKIDQNMQNAEDISDDINLGFNVPNLFTPFLNLFNNENNNCVSITNLATWIHSNETQICSPWSTEIRATITPVASFVVILLVFMFVIRWLNHNDLHEES